MKHFLISYFVTLAMVFPEIFSIKSKMQLVITGIEQCKTKENLSIDVGHWTIIQQEKSQFYVTGTLNISRDFPNGFDVGIVIDKCQGDARLGNCDTFMSNFAPKNICYLLKLRNHRIVTAFIDSLEPPLKCPIKAAEYRISDVKVDETLIQYLPQLGATFWRILITVRSGKSEIGCVEVYANVHSRRVRG